MTHGHAEDRAGAARSGTEHAERDGNAAGAASHPHTHDEPTSGGDEDTGRDGHEPGHGQEHEPGHGQEHEPGHGQEHGHGHDSHPDRGHGHDEHSVGHDTPGGHGGHAGHGDHVAQFRRLFWINLVLAVPTIGFSPMFASILGYPLPDLAITPWISPVLGTVMFVWGGRPFLTGAWAELRARTPGMMLLIGLAITVAYGASLGASLGLLDHHLDFWWELALLIVIMLLGHWIEMRSIAQAGSALDALAALLPDEAERVTDSGDGTTTTEAVAPSELRVGDVVVVRPGGRIPADGEVVEGTAAVDESMITGESATVTRGPGTQVVAGTVATDTAIRVRVTAVGADTALAGIQRLVAQAQASSSRAQRLADRAAAWLFWFALGAAVLTAVAWTLLGNPDDAVMRTITVLVIACPHALGLAIPLVVQIATERAARGGVLVTDRLALETMRTVDTVLFDKTGTLTRGEPAMTDASAAPGRDLDEVLALAAAAEGDSEHPLAKAIVQAAAARDLPRLAATDFAASPAVGVRAHVAAPVGRVASANAAPLAGRVASASERIETPHTEAGTQSPGLDTRPPSSGATRPTEASGATRPAETAGAVLVEVGGPALLEQSGLAPLEASVAWAEAGATVLHVLVDGEVAGALALADEIRPESRDAVDALHALGVHVVMITGDAEPVARTVAAELGIDRVFAGVRPEDKAAKVRELQRERRSVAMVGDGVNDAPALAQADVGIAIGAGTDVAIASAGVILASSDPRSVLSVIELSRASYRKMRQNLWWAAGYNLLSVPLAAGVLAPIGFVLPMSVGALLMSLSTVIVALNAQLLRRLDLRPEASARAALRR
ncbi:heavy metal translocating P-type ATPase [Agromyces aerolatus]|uniref:heavy metal translocating P-type ATPase n=1 Tax=Agromyces sp. LY-1074 TaxID=3074080 RepID=UPI0028654376|nr:MULTISPECIES: heavy metal translocating P-type ATPase [unclassified Agromyces]MDR5698651.1 heavy metal translocating P-type ATPase [Agromyces sp. LY-1074]MDR5704945.1 heavy metal translocating P-type ATPase [Agromyces sp. LY-1358]